MEYSKIVSVEIINFMAFKRAKVVFDESGVLNLKGYNGSGKSAILEALAVCFMDMFKSKQVKLIRHGEDYFRIIVKFDDDVTIIRDKYSNGQSLYEMYKGEECIFTTKENSRLTKVSEVPEIIQRYLGLCVTDSVYLNYASRRDPKLLVDTKGSENYQSLQEILRMAELYQASNMITSDKNAKSNEIGEIELYLQKEESLLNTCSYVSEGLLQAVEEKDKLSADLTERQEILEEMISTLDSMAMIPNIPKLERVDDSRLRDIYEVGSVVSALEKIKVYPRVETVDIERMSDIVGISEMIDSLERIKVAPEVPKVSEELLDKYDLILDILASISSVGDADMDIERYHKKLDEVYSEMDKIVVEAKRQGIRFVKCENCGSYVEVGGDHVH